MERQTKTKTRLNARVPDEMTPMYVALLDDGYTQAEIAREGIRTKYRQMINQQKAMEIIA